MITFVCSKDPANPSITNIEAAFTNATAAPMDSLNFQVAVPKYMQLKMTPPSSTTVPRSILMTRLDLPSPSLPCRIALPAWSARSVRSFEITSAFMRSALG